MARREIRCNSCAARFMVYENVPWINCVNCHSFINLQNYFPVAVAGNRRVPLPMIAPHVFKRRAVLCGVSYYGTDKALEGSINNVRDMTRFLVEVMRFHRDSILILSEQERDQRRIPTRYNMEVAMNWLVSGSQPGDSMLFYYAGHGSQVEDYDGDELDGSDEALCPVDFNHAGFIIDDDINKIMVRPLPTGSKLHAVVDTCRSGTILDLPYVYKMYRNGYEGWEDHRSHIYKGTQGGRAMSISACNDDQASGDTTILTGYSTGALTYSFIQVLTYQPKITYGDLLISLRRKISETKYMVAFNKNQPNITQTKQVPQLSSSNKFDVKFELFSM